MNRIRLVVAWLLLLALPLQGIAVHASDMSCDDGEKTAVLQTHGSHHGHGIAPAGHSHDGPVTGETQQHDGGETQVSASGHSCCHNLSTGVPPATNAGISESPREISSSVQLLTTLYIPELPQRPPRA